MRCWILSLAIFLAALAASRADPLFDHPRLDGAGGPDFKITLLDGKVAMLGGGPGCVVLDGSPWLGLGGW